MKKIILYFITSLTIFITIGCAINPKENISLTIKEGTLKRTGVTLILKNNSDKLLRYERVYKLEIKENDKWKQIDANIGYDMPLFEVKPNEQKDLSLNWSINYGSLTDGTYRITKEVYFKNEKDKKFDIIVSFVINDSIPKYDELKIKEESNIKIEENSDVLLSIKENSLNRSGLTLIQNNISYNDYSYSTYFEIEIYKNGKWYKTDVNLNFPYTSFPLNRGEIKETQIDWDSIYGELLPGKYRIIRYIYNDTKKIYIASSFVIE